MQNRVRFEIFKRDNFTCQYCGSNAPTVRLQIDHKVPLSKGGTDETSNLITSCSKCNYGKASNLLEDNELHQYGKIVKSRGKIYRQLKVPEDLHAGLKTLAAQRRITIIKLLEDYFLPKTKKQ